ncbi:glutamyl endopeptidase [Azospirillum tabaci]|uniref:glutamyl endopeptidase n=1 Tax=Azospirillum tabaci TaxID=2752310 RepID=UPI001B3C1074|nr:glutamyl endopeptidase [Azospirillum tabaci]
MLARWMVSRNPYWTDSNAESERKLESWQNPDAKITFSAGSSNYYENIGSTSGAFTTYEVIDFVTLSLSSNATYMFVAKGTYQVDISIFDSSGYLLNYKDGDDVGLPDAYGYDSIVGFKPDASGTYYLSVSNSFIRGSGVWGLAVAEDVGGDGKNTSSNPPVSNPSTQNDTIPSAPTTVTNPVTQTVEPTKIFARTVGAVSDSVASTTYSGPVSGLKWQFIGSSADEAVKGSADNDFLNMTAGNDAVDAGDGDDVIDGGTGSNFLTGGVGKDTYFVDGRGGGVTWSTVTDLDAGEWTTAWGWREGTSTITWAEMTGADNYKGATAHIDLDANGSIDMSVTFTGKAVGALTSTVGTVGADSYLAFILK